jgi:hypothetical protein
MVQQECLGTVDSSQASRPAALAAKAPFCAGRPNPGTRLPVNRWLYTATTSIGNICRGAASNGGRGMCRGKQGSGVSKAVGSVPIDEDEFDQMPR